MAQNQDSVAIDQPPLTTADGQLPPDPDSEDRGDGSRLDQLGRKARELSEKLSTVGIGGRGPWKGSIEVAEEHLAKHGDVDKAIERLIATHVRVTTGTGFLAGVGGLITLPVTVPADFATLWVTQARLAGAIAHLRGYDVHSDEVRSIVLISLIGSSATEALSQAGIQIGTKSAVSAIKLLPVRMVREINKIVGYRLLTKAGTKGVVNLTKLAPLVGGAVGGGINFASTRAVGTWAKRNFPASDGGGTASE
ncbi:EcsC family protein [Cellulomonas sp. GbtcB1]|uniref:EcsC family protein n=1 Tax=Cellulomonas sp. GbtcB1 TaxID=2824746 RepID=UPI001C30AFC6|nr:EcsC family protein [Cellulomonas sp. GbtcB1]